VAFVETKMVADLMEERAAYLLVERICGATGSKKWDAEEGDAVRSPGTELAGPSGKGNTFVQAKHVNCRCKLGSTQVGWPGPVGHGDGYSIQLVKKLCR
jgi:hypothetical protein